MSGLNPQELFGGKFRIKIDPANEKHRNIDPMYFVIPCQYGEIYPFSDDKLALMVTSIKVAKRLRREHPELKVHQDGLVQRAGQIEIGSEQHQPVLSMIDQLEQHGIEFVAPASQSQERRDADL